MAGEKCYLNGRILPVEQAGIRINDAGFLHGASAFTTMLAHNGVTFRLDRHLSRLMETVSLLSLRVEATAETLAAATVELLAANELRDARVRITLTPGPAGGEPAEPTVLVTASALPDYPRWWYEKGILVVVSSFKQMRADPTFGNKTGCYLPRVLALREAAGKGAEEALWYTPDNRLAEACFCNVFLVLGGKVCTPPRDMPVLPGVVREAVLELCGQLGIDSDAETPLTVKQMLAAEEMFITASCSGIRPVARVERHSVGQEKPGKVTRRLMAAYRELLEKECLEQVP